MTVSHGETRLFSVLFKARLLTWIPEARSKSCERQPRASLSARELLPYLNHSKKTPV